MKKYFLSICAVVLDEMPYIEEWIAFHQLQGVEHFYIYDNMSNDGTWEFLGAMERKGLVTRHAISTKPIQFIAYNKCLVRHGNESEWIAFLDCDEFLVSKLYPKASEILAELAPPIGAFAARWLLFGSNGQKTKQEGLVIERFTRCSAKPDQHIKSIVRTDAAVSVGKNPHYFVLKDGFHPIDENGIKLPEIYTFGDEDKDTWRTDVLCINHYHTKSFAEYRARKKRPDPGSNVIHDPKRVSEVMFKAFDLNEVEDLSAAKYASVVREQIERNRV